MNELDKIFDAKRIAIFGWPATGKFTFSRLLSDLLKINVYSLDEIRWKYSDNGVKDKKKFLEEYNKILSKNEWIIEGNALDYIKPRLDQSDILIFFDSNVNDCIINYTNREVRVNNGLEVRIAFDSSKSNDNTIDWIKNRYSKKIEKLRFVLADYYEKLIVIHNYDELDSLIEMISSD